MNLNLKKYKTIDDDFDEEEGEMLALRRANIERNKKIFAEMFRDNPELCPPVEEKKVQTKKHSKPKVIEPIEIRRSSRKKGLPVKYDESELDKLFDDEDRIKRKRSYHEMMNGKENVAAKWKISMRRSTSVPSLSVTEVTDEHVRNIAQKLTERTYSKLGSSCHQCRQKTLDTKSFCRSGTCIGVRGQFCGPCLRGRYGEEVSEVLYDSNWSCPPCRGICNCSICLSRQGYAPTGILQPYVVQKGYKSVKHYLEAISPDVEVIIPEKEKTVRISNFGSDIMDIIPIEIPDNFRGFESFSIK